MFCPAPHNVPNFFNDSSIDTESLDKQECYAAGNVLENSRNTCSSRCAVTFPERFDHNVLSGPPNVPDFSMLHLLILKASTNIRY